MFKIFGIENATNQAMSECPKTTDAELDIHQQNIVDVVANSVVDSRSVALEELNRLDSGRANIERDIQGFSLNQILLILI